MSALRDEADMPRPPAPYQSDVNDPKADIGQIEIPQRSIAVLSFVGAWEALSGETARVHHAGRRRGGMAARGASAAV
jgi:hypothetical protein